MLERFCLAASGLRNLRWALVALAGLALVLALPPQGAEASHVNPGFETGNLNGWTLGATVEGVTVVGTDSIAQGISQTPLEGSYMARLGEPKPSPSQNQTMGQNELFQTFTITETAVTFAYNLWTYDYTGYDRFSVELRLTGSGTVVYSYSQQAWGTSFDTTRKNSGWQVVNIDTHQYIGQQARLTFSAGGSIDNLYAFWAYIDSAESAIPPQVVDFPGITINGYHPSRDPANQTIHVTRPPNTGFFDITVPVLCPDGSTPDSVSLIVGTSPPTSVSLTKGAGDEWSGRVNTPAGTAGQSFPLTLVIDCDGVIITIYIGSLTLIDPSGFITDAESDLPIPEATVTLQRLEGNQWEVVNPYATNQDGSPQIAPKVNPQKTDEDGHYGWDVIAGTYRVVVTAEGYFGQTSPQVTVPPPVFDLNLELQPLVQMLQGDVDCNGVANSVDALKVLREVAGFGEPPCAQAGDVNCDGADTAVDALFILRYVAFLPVNQPPSCTDIGDPLPE
jgi:5-hydroxyisourate hydrolase-like protein (transthyretin family)